MLDSKVFITGATGLLGSHILRLLLLKGYTNVVALRRTDARMDLVKDVENRVTWFDGDVSDSDSLEGPMQGVTHVIHAAALISYDKKSRSRLFDVNVNGTRNVVNIALDNSVKKLIHISSISAFTRTGKHQWIDEETEWIPTRYTSEYGLTKYLSEMEAWRGDAEGLSTSVVIPSVIMGSGFWDEGSLTMFREASKGISICPSGSIGFVDVRDVAQLVILLLECEDQCNGRYIANGYNLSYSEIFTLIAEHFGHAPPKHFMSEAMGELAWRLIFPTKLFTGKTPVISKQTVRTTTCKLNFDNSKSLSVDGMEYTPLDDTLQDVIAKFKTTSDKKTAAEPLAFRPRHLA